MSSMFAKKNTSCVLKLMESSQKLLVLKYSSALDEEGNPISDPYSGGLVIDITTSVQVLIAPVTAILRKAMLYNYNDPLHPGRRTVLDFQRESLPITWGDIQVPFLPQVGDMILIKGDDPDPWLAKVLTVKKGQRLPKFGTIQRMWKGLVETCRYHTVARDRPKMLSRGTQFCVIQVVNGEEMHGYQTCTRQFRFS